MHSLNQEKSKAVVYLIIGLTIVVLAIILFNKFMGLGSGIF